MYGTALLKSYFGSHINSSNIENVIQRAIDDYANNAENVRFKKDGYKKGKHWILVDMSGHSDLLDNGYIGKYVSSDGLTKLDVTHILITVDDDYNMFNAFPTNLVLENF